MLDQITARSYSFFKKHLLYLLGFSLFPLGLVAYQFTPWVRADWKKICDFHIGNDNDLASCYRQLAYLDKNAVQSIEIILGFMAGLVVLFALLWFLKKLRPA